MPIGEANARHLLRRTEFVDRSARVATLARMEVGEAVDTILDTTTADAPGRLDRGTGENWEQGENLSRSWLDRMTGRVGRSPLRERMAFFWHGHLVSDNEKVRSGLRMGEQIDLYRRDGVNGTFGQMLKDMSIQVAMLRYLDNERNYASSPNQNFARELMELFVLGVGNYTEADVEAATDAWTGHTTTYWEGDAGYEFQQPNHVYGAQSFLGRTVNQDDQPHRLAGFQTIDVMLGLGAYPGGGTVPVGPNAGRPTDVVAAEFLSKKLWQEFGEANSGTVPRGVLDAMVDALVGNGFAIRPWVRAMLTHPDFYPSDNPAVAGGLVRQPVEYVVAIMAATGRDADTVSSLWLMDQTGQRLLYPPNVSGWRPNGYWVNASAMEGRNRIAQHAVWKVKSDYWKHSWEQHDLNFMRFVNGRVWADEITGRRDRDLLSDDELVDRLLAVMDLRFGNRTRQQLVAYCRSFGPDEKGNRHDLPLLILLAPEMHVN